MSLLPGCVLRSQVLSAVGVSIGHLPVTAGPFLLLLLCVACLCRSEMHGLLQTSFFFGYNAVVCFAFFLMLGSVGWRASLLFVRSIYKVRLPHG